MSRNLRLAVLGLTTALGLAWGQGAVGTLNGTILDESGSVVPAATVRATNFYTGIENRTASTSSGAYTLPYLPAGMYTLSATAPGFRTSTAKNIVLHVGQTLTKNITLEPGIVSEEVTVSSTPPLLESGTAEIGRYISAEEYDSWPVLVEDGQRQIQSFIFRSLPGTTGGEFQGSINGGQQYSHEILIEGIPVGRSDLMGGNNNEMSPSAEAIAEFKLHTGAIGAQYNGGQTAVANFAVKYGTNDPHGSVFYYGQNDALNSNTVAQNSGAADKSPLRQHNYGYALGGPVYVPKVYDGRNKTFFFTNLEVTDRNELYIEGIDLTLPTLDFKSGDFSRLLNPAFTGQAASGTVVGQDALGRDVRFGQIYDPSTTSYGPDGKPIREPFPGNIIPRSRWNPVSVNVVEGVGIIDPDIDSMIRNKARLGNAPDFHLHTIMVKMDHQITAGHRISGMYNHEHRAGLGTNPGASYLPFEELPTQTWRTQTTPSRMVRLSLDSTISGSLLNRIAAGYNRFGNINTTEWVDQDWASKIGVKNTAPSHFPNMSFAGNEWQGGSTVPLGSLADGGGSYNGSWIVQDDLTLIKAAHTMRFGYEYRRYFYNDRPKSGSGQFRFSPVSTHQPGFANETGHAFASFLLGAIQESAWPRDVVTLAGGYRYPSHALYAMDDWKVTPRLTLNLGLRWEIIGAFHEVTDRMSMIDLNEPNPAADGHPGALVFADRFQDVNWTQLGPRLGFAYRASDKMVARGGFAITNMPNITHWGGPEFSYGFNGSIPVNAGTSPTGFVDDPAMYLDQPYPDLPGSLPNTDGASANFNSWNVTTAPDSNRLSYVTNWNLTIQHELPRESVLEVAYVGNKGTRLMAFPFGSMNALRPEALALGDALLDPVGQHPELKPYPSFAGFWPVSQALRPYPQYFGLWEFYPRCGNSLYNSLQLTLSRRFTGGLGVMAAYTFAKTIGQVNSTNIFTDDLQVQDPYNRGLERSLTSFSYPHDFKLSWIWEVPIGRGKPADLGRFNWALGGWSLSGIHRYRSGSPVTVNQSGIRNILLLRQIRPDVTGSPQTLGGAPAEVDFFQGTPYLDPKGFAESPRTGNGVPLRMGTAPRYLPQVRGPHRSSEDFRISKLFRFSERLSLRFGAVFINAFNRTEREFLSTNVSESGFGKLVARGEGRKVQLEGRIEW